MFAKMVKELQTATQEEDMGYLNSELFLQSERTQNNVSMVSLSYPSPHIVGLADEYLFCLGNTGGYLLEIIRTYSPLRSP